MKLIPRNELHQPCYYHHLYSLAIKNEKTGKYYADGLHALLAVNTPYSYGICLVGEDTDYFEETLYEDVYCEKVFIYEEEDMVRLHTLLGNLINKPIDCSWKELFKNDYTKRTSFV